MRNGPLHNPRRTWRLLQIGTGILLLALHCQTIRTGQEDKSETTGDEPPETGMCAICHVDVILSWQNSKHYNTAIGCTPCHGTSEEHIRVEDNSIKPEISFGRAGVEINAFCQKSCHATLSSGSHSEVDGCVSCHPAHAFNVPDI